MKTTTITIKLEQLAIFRNVMSPLLLEIEESSARRRFLRLFKDIYEDYDAEADEIRKKYATKTETEEIKMIGKEIQYTKENKKLADKAFEELNTRPVTVDYTKNVSDKKKCVEIFGKNIKEIKEKLKEKGGMTDADFEGIEILEEILTVLKK